MFKKQIGQKEFMAIADSNGGFEAYVQKDKVIVTTYIRGEARGSETSIEIPRNLWNSLAGSSLRMVRE
jgi:hypothetical protein